MPTRAKRHWGKSSGPNKRERQRLYDRQFRGKRLFYTTFRWKKLRRWFLNSHPFCVKCGAVARVVDHIIGRWVRPDLEWEVSNLQAMCKKCHDRKSKAEEQGKDA